MPKINVYLPDDLAAEVRATQLPVSAICQLALREALEQHTGAVSAPASGLPLSPHVTAVLELAPAAAARRGSETVESEDLLQAILDEGESLVLRGLDHLGLAPSAIQEALNTSVEHGNPMLEDAVTVGQSVSGVLNAAVADARAGDNDTVNSSNLLWALATTKSGRSRAILERLDFCNRVGRDVLGLIEIGFRYGRGRQPGQASILTELTRINRRLDVIERSGGLDARQ